MLASVSDHFRTIVGLLHCFFRLQEMVSGITDWNYSEACASCIQMLSLYKALQEEALSLEEIVLGNSCPCATCCKSSLSMDLRSLGCLASFGAIAMSLGVTSGREHHPGGEVRTAREQPH